MKRLTKNKTKQLQDITKNTTITKTTKQFDRLMIAWDMNTLQAQLQVQLHLQLRLQLHLQLHLQLQVVQQKK